MSKSIAIIYGTTDGHTKKVAGAMASRLQSMNYQCVVKDVRQLDDDFSLSRFQGILIGGSVHAGKYQHGIVRFIQRHRDRLEDMPNGFFSVSMGSAAHDEKAQSEAHNYILQMIDQTGWQPAMTKAVAGAILYTQYGFFKRLLMKTISKRAGGDTDTSRDFDYTNWSEVEAFAVDFARLVEDRYQMEQPFAP